MQFQWGMKTKDGLSQKGVTNYELKSYTGIGHTITLDIVNDAETFLKKILPYDVNYIIKGT